MTEENEFDENLPNPVRSILGTYRSVLYQEMFFLRDNGGRRYKATNGKLIGKSGEGFAYSFDLEAELFLSEDSPVTVTAGSESATGKVLACEDFEVILILALNLGAKVPLGVHQRRALEAARFNERAPFDTQSEEESHCGQTAP